MFDPAKNLDPFEGSGGAYAEEYFSGEANSVLCEMSLFISTFVHVVPPMFDLAHYWGPYLGLYVSPTAGGLQQTSISDYGRLHNINMFLYSDLGAFFV